MLFAAEGGGFFSSSASGYSNGLALLLLGHNKNEPQPKPTNPWNHYHLVLEDSDSATTSPRSCLSSTCTSLVCFRRKSQSRENPSPIGGLPSNSSVDYNGGVSNRFALKSSLKKRSFSDVVLADEDGVLDHADRRKVQWPDTCGIEIAEVREFEPSEVDASDDEFQGGSGKSCMCTIM